MCADRVDSVGLCGGHSCGGVCSRPAGFRRLSDAASGRRWRKPQRRSAEPDPLRQRGPEGEPQTNKHSQHFKAAGRFSLWQTSPDAETQQEQSACNGRLPDP